jgi:hypothetical protein
VSGETYKGVPVPPRLRQYWTKPTGRWWRQGVDAALVEARAAVALEQLQEDRINAQDTGYRGGISDALFALDMMMGAGE